MDPKKFDKLVSAIGRREALGIALGAAIISVTGVSKVSAKKGKVRAKPACRIQGHPCEGNQQCCPVAGQTVLCQPIPGKGVADRCTVANPPPPPPVCTPLGSACQFATECCGTLLCVNGTCQDESVIPDPDFGPGRGGNDPGSRTKRRCRSGKAQSKRCKGHQKLEHCHTDEECAPGWQCIGGAKDSGKHKSCRRR
jgi:hypothetical protein